MHNALYKLLDNGGEPLSHITKLQEAIETILEHASVDEYPKLVQAFYEPNGVLKEIAHQVPQTEQLELPSEILSPEHASTRNKLNTLLHTAHADPTATEHAQKELQDLQQSFVKNNVAPDVGIQNAAPDAVQNSTTQVTAANNALFKQIAAEALKQKIAPIKQDAGNASQNAQQKPVIIDEIKTGMPMPQGPEWEPEKEKTKTEDTLQKTSVEWDMPEKGKIINGRYYTKHALERMAPDTPQIRAELEKRATELGYKRGSEKFIEYVKPRGIPPSVVENAIKSATPEKGNTADTFVCLTDEIKVIINKTGDVVSVFRQ